MKSLNPTDLSSESAQCFEVARIRSGILPLMSQHLFLKASSSFGTLGPRHYKLRDMDIYIKLISICNGKTRVCTANVLHVAALSLKASSFLVASLCCTAPVFNYFTVRHSVSEETRSTKQRNHCVSHGVTACTHTPSASSTARCSGRCCQATISLRKITQ